MIKQSGKSEGKRRARGGQGSVRQVLYMSALVATKRNPVIDKFYIRLLSQRKPKKVALVAYMRKLLTMINDMVRQQTKWQEQKKRALQVQLFPIDLQPRTCSLRINLSATELSLAKLCLHRARLRLSQRRSS
jgi:hypothetical protein